MKAIVTTVTDALQRAITLVVRNPEGKTCDYSGCHRNSVATFRLDMPKKFGLYFLFCCEACRQQAVKEWEIEVAE